MKDALDFQSIIMALQQYWAGQGCLIWQPYYSQVGAGTMNPATFLRVLGPEPLLDFSGLIIHLLSLHNPKGVFSFTYIVHDAGLPGNFTSR